MQNLARDGKGFALPAVWYATLLNSALLVVELNCQTLSDRGTESQRNLDRDESDASIVCFAALMFFPSWPGYRLRPFAWLLTHDPAFFFGRMKKGGEN